MDFFKLREAIASDAVPPLVYLYGNEPYLVSAALKELKAHVLTVAPDFNFTELDAKEQPIDKLIAAAELLPMMAPRRLVVVRRADEIKAEAAERLLAYVQKPAPSTVLVMVAATLDARTKLAKALQAAKAAVDCGQLKKPQLFQFVGAKLKAEGLRVAPEVYDILFEAYGQDLAQWLLAIDRMALFVANPDGSAGDITAEAAHELVFRTRAESIFALTDAVIAKDTADALAIIEELMRQKEAPLAMVGLCARQLRQLIVLREAIERGESPRDHLRTAGIPPFAADKYLDSARKSKLVELKQAHRRLAEADYLLKSSPLDANVTWFAALWNVMD